MPAEGDEAVHHALAEIRFLTPDEGGRTLPVYSGYRGQFYYDGADWDAIQTYPSEGPVNPGESVRALLWFTNPDAHRGRLYPGKQFEVREGRHVVGRGVIIRLLGL